MVEATAAKSKDLVIAVSTMTESAPGGKADTAPTRPLAPAPPLEDADPGRDVGLVVAEGVLVRSSHQNGMSSFDGPTGARRNRMSRATTTMRSRR